MDTPDTAPAPEKETIVQQTTSVGTALREARERLGMTVNDIAERIKFAPRQVEALEADDFAHLPQATFLRGFVRSYARVLQLDEAALIAALPVEQKPQPVSKPVAGVAFPAMHSISRTNMYWLAGALGVALVLVLTVRMLEIEPRPMPTEVVVESVPLPAADATASAVVAAESLKPEIAEKAAEPVKTEPAKAARTATATEVQVAAASAPAATVKTPVPLELLKRRPMHFVFSEDAWAEVVDAKGTLLLSRTNPAGSEQWIGGPGRAPYAVAISKPATVKLYYKGKQIDLSPYAGMEVARLTVE